MERNKRVAALAVCMLILLSGQLLQVAADEPKPSPCKCKDCYLKCYCELRRQDYSPQHCNLKCCKRCLNCELAATDGCCMKICHLGTAATGYGVIHADDDYDATTCAPDPTCTKQA